MIGYQRAASLFGLAMVGAAACSAPPEPAAPVAPPQPSELRPLPAAPMSARYDVKWRGFRVGMAETHLGRVEQRSDGSRVRTFRMVLRSTGLAASFQSFERTLDSVVDALTNQPLLSKTRARIGSDSWGWKYDYRGDRVVILGGSDKRKEPLRLEEPRRGPTDQAAFLLWLQGAPPREGEQREFQLLAGNGYRKATVRAGRDRMLELPSGLQRAVPIRFHLHGEDPLTVWLARDRFRTPVKLRVNVEGLGKVQLELTHRFTPSPGGPR